MSTPSLPHPPLVTDLERLVDAHGAASYREFLRVPALSLGLFAVGPGHADGQEPHQRDEVYVVAAGSATLLVGEDRHAVAPGAIAYVPAGVPHRFCDVVGDLRIFVLFAPPEPA